MLHKQVSFIVDSKGVKQAAVVPIDIYNELMTLQKALSDNKPGERELYHFNGKGAEAHGYPVGKRQNPGFMVQAGSTANGEKRLLLQIFSQTLLGPVFFEFIQRKADEGFGEGNFKALFESLERDQIRRGAIQVEEVA